MFSMHAVVSLDLHISFLSKTYHFEKYLLTRGWHTRTHRPSLLVNWFEKKKLLPVTPICFPIVSGCFHIPVLNICHRG